MARLTNTTLTDKHMEILNYAHVYYEKNKVGPLFHNLKKHLGVTKEEINSLFPHGLSSIYTWVGIPIHTTEEGCKPIQDLKVPDYRKVYLDYNATTFVRHEVAEVLIRYYKGEEGFGNPSSSYKVGKKAWDLITDARRSLAGLLNVAPEEFVFTGCGSESNNLAIKGIAFNYLSEKGHIITTNIEHASVLNTMKDLEDLGFDITYVPVESTGLVNPEHIEEAIREDTILVAVMAVNNEIGIINPIQEIGSICKKNNIPLMVDGIQAFGKIPFNPRELGISLMSLSGHKLYAPKGIGGLFVDHTVHLRPLIHGGSQELGLRAGTENVGHIIAFQKAAKLAHSEMASETPRLNRLRELFLQYLENMGHEYIINGDLVNRMPNNLSVGFKGVDSGTLLMSLNSIGVSASAGSACSAGKISTSHVLKAIGSDADNYGTIRFSFGLHSTSVDIDYLFKYLPEILRKIKEQEPT